MVRLILLSLVLLLVIVDDVNGSSSTGKSRSGSSSTGRTFGNIRRSNIIPLLTRLLRPIGEKSVQDDVALEQTNPPVSTTNPPVPTTNPPVSTTNPPVPTTNSPVPTTTGCPWNFITGAGRNVNPDVIKSTVSPIAQEFNCNNLCSSNSNCVDYKYVASNSTCILNNGLLNTTTVGRTLECWDICQTTPYCLTVFVISDVSPMTCFLYNRRFEDSELIRDSASVILHTRRRICD